MDFIHVLNRGVEGKTIFPQTGDYVRFVHGLYSFNDSASANNTSHSLRSGSIKKQRHRLVDIHGWCLMRNHYHLLLSELEEGGISKFMMKLNVGYAKYFNDKYDRKGYVFQGRTKKVPIVRDSHFNHILNYIHLNPLDYLRGAEKWRARSVKNVASAEKFLKHYRWSSYLDYCGQNNFPSIITTEFFGDAFGNYQKHLSKYLLEIEMKPISDFSLE
jgi:putative transposase